MKMEVVIVCIVIIMIIFLNIITANYTDNVMGEVTMDLNEIREQLISNNQEKLETNIDKVIKKWEDKKDLLAFYIEHTELEKVELYLYEINSNVETKEFNIAIQSLDSCNFIISHIKDKYKIALKNIF